MPTYTVEYREEFALDIKARNPREAIQKFITNKKGIYVIGELYEEYFTIRDSNGFIVYPNTTIKKPSETL